MTQKSKGITVVIPTFNGASYLSEAIASALSQSADRPIQVIVVDDGSTDNTHELMSRYGSRITAIHKENGGVSSARNLGISRAKYPLVALLDADDRMNPGRLAAQAAALELSESAVLCCSSVEFIDSKGKLLEAQPMPLSSDPPLRESITRRLFQRNFVSTSSVMIRRDAVMEAGGFDETLHYSEDFDLWLRLSLAGQFIILADRLTQYRSHNNQTVSNMLLMAQGRLEVRNRFLERLPNNQKVIPKSDIKKIIPELAIDYG